MTTKRAGTRKKRVPQRICISCRAPAAKRSLVRLVRTDEGVEIDLTGKKPGRGAYICRQFSCWENVLKSNRIEQALRTRLSASNREELSQFMNSLTAGQHE